MTLTTVRLTLRPWRDTDREPFARLNADPMVMRYFPARLSRAESDHLMDRMDDHHHRHGFGFLAVELNATGEFIGLIGLDRPTFETGFTPCVAAGWRLAVAHWGNGYATEGASAVLAHAFQQLGLDEIVSFTVPANRASRRVMEKLGFRHQPAEDFYHPRVPTGHPMRPHVLYRLRRDEWLCYPERTHHG